MRVTVRNASGRSFILHASLQYIGQPAVGSTRSMVVSRSAFEDCRSPGGAIIRINDGSATLRQVTVRRSVVAPSGSCVFVNQSGCPDCEVSMNDSVALESCDGVWPVSVSCALCGAGASFLRPPAATCWFPTAATDVGCGNTVCKVPSLAPCNETPPTPTDATANVTVAPNGTVTATKNNVTFNRLWVMP